MENDPQSTRFQRERGWREWGKVEEHQERMASSRGITVGIEVETHRGMESLGYGRELENLEGLLGGTDLHWNSAELVEIGGGELLDQSGLNLTNVLKMWE